MMTEKARFAELDYRYTEVDYCRIDIRLTTPGATQTKTYSIKEDWRLMGFEVGKIPERRDFTSDLAWQIAYQRWAKRKEWQKKHIDALATKIAFALYKELDQENGR